MLAVRIELLTGRYAATRFNDRNATEWPPHPARLFSAMVAMWADVDEPDPAERAALTWFEELGAPDITASEAFPRNPVTFFVPNNEAAAVVVPDQSKNYARLAEVGMALADAHARLAVDPADKVAQKDADRQGKAFEKLRAKIETDSLKGSAAKATESPGAVRAGVQLLPEERGKQGRTFPVVIPHDPVVMFTWPEAGPSADVCSVLDGLLARVARLGHSSSMVSCTLVDKAPSPTLVASSEGSTVIRVTAAGLLDELELAYAGHQASEPRVLPSVLVTYRRPGKVAALVPRPYLGDDWIVLSDVGRDKLPLTRALDLTTAVRGALLSFAEDPLQEILSGHVFSEDGAKTPASERPHLAVVALPFVGHRHADGHIRGVGLLMPRSAAPEEREAVADAVHRWVASSGTGHAVVTMGRAGIRRLEMSDQINPIESLRSETWCRPARRWTSVTPVALDRFPGDLWSPDPDKHTTAEDRAVQVVRRAFTHVGLPEPAAVELLRSGPLMGVPDLRRFPAYRSPGRKLGRMTVHVRVDFDQQVAGPMLIGAGRYFGYGLLRPVPSVKPAQNDGSAALDKAASDEVAS